MVFEKFVFNRKTCLYLNCVFLGIIIVYFWSMPRTVVLEDDGYFILASYFNAYAHPPGYPLYSLLGKLATLIPVGSVASRVHALSAVTGALACICLWVIAKMLFKQDLLATIAALCFAFSAIFWSQAIIAEVYTLNVLLFLLLVYLALRLRESGQNKYCLKWMGLIYGLSLCNHWPLLLLSTPLLVAFLWPQRNKFLHYIWLSAPFLILGLSPYVWMVIRSFIIPELNFGGPFETVSDFWRYLSREDFSDVDSSPSAGWSDKILFSVFALHQTARQFGVPLSILVLVGFVCQWRYFPKNISTGLLLGFLGNTFLLILLLDFDYDLFHRNTFRVYPVIAYAICTIWLALGFHKVLHTIYKISGEINKGLISNGLTIIAVGIVFFTNMPINYRGNDTWAEDYARVILNNIENNAVLYANADTINGPVGYLNRIEKVRDDITLYSGSSIDISGKFYRLYQYKGVELDRLVNDFIHSEIRPIYYTNDFPNHCGGGDYGLFFKTDSADCDGSYLTVISPQIANYYKKIALQSKPHDPWESMHYWLLRKDYCRLVINTVDLKRLPETGVLDNSRLVLACGHYLGVNSLIKALLAQSSVKDYRQWKFIESLIELAETYRSDQAFTKADYVELDFLRGEMWHLRERDDEALVSYQRALNGWQHPANMAKSRIEILQSPD
jgi:transmembrane protein TMEM260 (protein O-mannosyltransferase)